MFRFFWREIYVAVLKNYPSLVHFSLYHHKYYRYNELYHQKLKHSCNFDKKQRSKTNVFVNKTIHLPCTCRKPLLSIYFSVFEIVDVFVVDTVFSSVFDRSIFIGMFSLMFLNRTFSKTNRYFLPCRIYNSVVVKNN